MAEIKLPKEYLIETWIPAPWYLFDFFFSLFDFFFRDLKLFRLKLVQMSLNWFLWILKRHQPIIHLWLLPWNHRTFSSKFNFNFFPIILGQIFFFSFLIFFREVIPSPRVPTPEEKLELRRKNLIEEIVETEKSYCKKVQSLLEFYAIPLGESKIVSEEIIDTIFPISSIRQILSLTESALKTLQEKVILLSNDEHVIIGDVFEKMVCFCFFKGLFLGHVFGTVRAVY